MLEANLCRVNQRVERFGSRLVQRGDVVEFSPSWQSKTARKERATFSVLYEDEEIKVVNKPSGWVCSKENVLRDFGSDLELIHRLDKDTTGVLLLAKHPEAFHQWTDLFAERKIHKRYLAIVDGIPKEDCGVRESYLGRKKVFHGQTIWGSSSKGLHAVTHWQVLARGEQAALVECQPITGRTHQIRVHLAEMGHPVLVDRQYCARFRSQFVVSRPLLHAFQLKTGSLTAVAPLPLDMQEALCALKMEGIAPCTIDRLALS